MTDLFHSRDRNFIVQLPFRARLLQVIIDLSGAEQQSLDAVGILGRWAFLRYHSKELRVLEHQIEARLSLRVTEQRFWCHQDQWLSERQSNLPTQDVEVIGRRAAVGDNPVAIVQLTNSKLLAFRWEVIRIIGGHLEETFQTSTRVLGTL